MLYALFISDRSTSTSTFYLTDTILSTITRITMNYYLADRSKVAEVEMIKRR